MQKNYIPELTQLSLENISFSGNGVLNGAHTVSGLLGMCWRRKDMSRNL